MRGIVTQELEIRLPALQVVDVGECSGASHHAVVAGRPVPHGETCLGPEPRPASLWLEDVGKVEVALMEEGRQGDVAACTAERLQLTDHRGPPGLHLSSDVLQDNLLTLAIQDDLTPGGKEREALLDLIAKTGPRSTGERAELLVEAKLLAVVPDEVQGGQYGLIGRGPQASTELLQEDGGALRRPEEQHGVDLR